MLILPALLEAEADDQKFQVAQDNLVPSCSKQNSKNRLRI